MIKRDFRRQGGKEKAQRREAESRGPEMTDGSGVEGRDGISADAPKAGEKGNRVSIAVQRGRRNASSLSDHVLCTLNPIMRQFSTVLHAFPNGNT